MHHFFGIEVSVHTVDVAHNVRLGRVEGVQLGCLDDVSLEPAEQR